MTEVDMAAHHCRHPRATKTDTVVITTAGRAMSTAIAIGIGIGIGRDCRTMIGIAGTGMFGEPGAGVPIDHGIETEMHTDNIHIQWSYGCV